MPYSRQLPSAPAGPCSPKRHLSAPYLISYRDMVRLAVLACTLLWAAGCSSSAIASAAANQGTQQIRPSGDARSSIDAIGSTDLAARPSDASTPVEFFVMSRCPDAIACEARLNDVVKVRTEGGPSLRCMVVICEAGLPHPANAINMRGRLDNARRPSAGGAWQ